MKIDIASIFIKWVLEKSIKGLCFLWKKNPNYIIFFILNSILTIAVSCAFMKHYDNKKKTLAFYAYQKGQRDVVDLREKEQVLLKDCVDADNIHISNIFVDTININAIKQKYNGLIEDELGLKGKYVFTIAEVNTKHALFCFNSIADLPSNKQYCVSNTKYLNAAYQGKIYSDPALDYLLDKIMINNNIYSEDVDIFAQNQPFFAKIKNYTNYKLVGDIFISVVSYKDIPYLIITITTTEGYNFSCNFSKMLLELQSYQQTQLDKLEQYAEQL